MLDDGHARFLRNALDQPLAAARHDYVDELGHGNQIADRGAIRGLDHLHRRFRESGRPEAGAHAGGDGLVAADRFLAATQDRRIAGLQAERCRVSGDVRPRFVDDADHTERHTHLANLDAGRAALEIGDLAHGIGQRGDLFEALRHLLDALGGQRQAVDQRCLQAIGFRLRHVGGVGDE